MQQAKQTRPILVSPLELHMLFPLLCIDIGVISFHAFKPLCIIGSVSY
jgi:hypothetical protein